MGWSTKHGLRPNRTRACHKGREPCREVGVLTRTVTEVRVDRDGWHRATWSRDYTLHPTKGFRVASCVRAIFDDMDNAIARRMRAAINGQWPS